jgi:hypothetical protein
MGTRLLHLCSYLIQCCYKPQRRERAHSYSPPGACPSNGVTSAEYMGRGESELGRIIGTTEGAYAASCMGVSGKNPSR